MTRTGKIGLICALILIISVLHYQTDIHHPLLHVIHRELYLIPIILAAYWFGKKGGLAASVVSSVLFLPWAFMSHEASSAYHINNVLQILMFNVVAYIIGAYRDIRRSQYTTVWKHQEEGSPRHGHNSILVCLDSAQNAPKAAQYVVDTFARSDNMVITILGLIREPSEDLFGSREEYSSVRTESEKYVLELVHSAHKLLLSKGFPQETIQTKYSRSQLRGHLGWRM